jgi:hypothetical protein
LQRRGARCRGAFFVMKLTRRAPHSTQGAPSQPPDELLRTHPHLRL